MGKAGGPFHHLGLPESGPAVLSLPKGGNHEQDPQKNQVIKNGKKGRARYPGLLASPSPGGQGHGKLFDLLASSALQSKACIQRCPQTGPELVFPETPVKDKDAPVTTATSRPAP